MSPQHTRLRFVLFLAILIIGIIGKEEDLYKILGIPKTATTKEIKKAYRRKALDTHPDKNKNVPPEEAAEAFHKVVHAFEILSDGDSRRRYDRTGQQGQQQQQQQKHRSGGGGSSWSFSWSSGRNQQRSYKRPKLKDKFEVKEAQSRVLHIVSLEQLETVIVDDDTDTLERNLLICFYTPPLEEHVNDEMVYPYPFAAKSSQGIWWEDLLQTTSVRFHRSNKLTELFGIPDGKQMGQTTQPIFLFGKRGQRLDESAKSWPRIATRDRQSFERWMWEQIKVSVEFINHHDHPVEIYWIHGTKATISETLKPGASATHTTMLSHEWWVRDARTDTRKDSPGRWRLADGTSLITWKILSDEHGQKLIIPRRTCFDLSGHCSYWKSQGECHKNAVFMSEECALTCGHCEKEKDEKNKDPKDGDHDEL
jgi:curved DNA-binding protein CbpA